MINVLADQHLFKITEIVPAYIDLTLYDPEKGLPHDLNGADALLIRTVTPINKETLYPIPKKLKFVATGSAGFDHVDERYLEENEVMFSYAAGCNARSVAEYVVTSLMMWGDRRGVDIANETIGIVGVGHVGSEVRKMCEKLGWNFRLYDPPRAVRDDSFESVPLPDLLDSSILTFHTPLTRQGKYRTYHWLDEEVLSKHSYNCIINTSRGGVVNETDLLRSMDRGNVADIIIDVWEGEPGFSDATAANAFLATPHIAGYSVQAKYRASRSIVCDLLDFFSLNLPVGELCVSPDPIELPPYELNGLGLSDMLTRIHPLQNYHDELHSLIGLPPQEKGPGFRRLRTALPYRNEFGDLRFESPDTLLNKFPILKSILY